MSVVEPAHGVYFIEGGDLIKIGVSADVFDRAVQIRAMSPVYVRLVSYIAGATQDLERWLHRHLDEHRHHGEWFVRHPEVLAIAHGHDLRELPEFPKGDALARMGLRRTGTAATLVENELPWRRGPRGRGLRFGAEQIERVATLLERDRAIDAARAAVRSVLSSPDVAAMVQAAVEARIPHAEEIEPRPHGEWTPVLEETA